MTHLLSSSAFFFFVFHSQFQPVKKCNTLMCLPQKPTPSNESSVMLEDSNQLSCPLSQLYLEILFEIASSTSFSDFLHLSVHTCLFIQCCHLFTPIKSHLSSNKRLPREWNTPMLPWRHLSAWSCRAGSWIQQMIDSSTLRGRVSQAFTFPEVFNDFQKSLERSGSQGWFSLLFL